MGRVDRIWGGARSVLEEMSPVPAPAPTPTVGAGNRLAQIIFQKNEAAEAEQKKRDAEQQKRNIAARDAGFMSDEEFQGLESKGFETTRAQFGNVAREFGEGAYNRVNTGALRAGARDIKIAEAGAIGTGVRELGLERLRRKAESSRVFAQAEQTRESQFQIPGYNIPSTFDKSQQAQAISGQRSSEPDVSTRKTTTSVWNPTSKSWYEPSPDSAYSRSVLSKRHIF